MAHSDETIANALKMYEEHPEIKTKDIAKKFQIWPATLSGWVKSCGIVPRSRGVKKAGQPSALALRIIKLAEVCSLEEVARRVKRSKQRVHQIVQRWPEYAKRDVPFKTGDVLKLGNHPVTYTVVEAGPYFGVVKNNKTGRKIYNFRWAMRGQVCEKVDPATVARKNGTSVRSRRSRHR